MHIFGHATLIGVMFHLADEPEPKPHIGRIYDKGKGFVALHWHTDGECREVQFRSLAEAIKNAEGLKLTHVFLGTTHNVNDILPIEEAKILGFIDGTVAIADAFQSPFGHAFHTAGLDGNHNLN